LWAEILKHDQYYLNEIILIFADICEQGQHYAQQDNELSSVREE